MNKLIKLMLAAVVCFGLAGCITNSDGTKQINSKVILVSELASYNGATIFLDKNPLSRPKFEKAIEELNVLLDKGVTVEGITAVVKGLPIKELESPEGKLIINNAIIIFGVFSDDIVTLPALEKARLLAPVAAAIRDGLQQALDDTVPAK